MIDNHLFLLGRPPLAEFLAVMEAQAASGQLSSADAAEAWRQANDRIVALQSSEAGAADGHQAQQLAASQQAHADKLTALPLYQRVHARVPTVVALVELDRLVVAQKHINLAYVEAIQDSLDESPSDDAVNDLCLPLAPQGQGVEAARVAKDSVIFSSRSADLRVLDQKLLSIDALSEPVTGHGAHLLAIAVGSSLNCLSAIHINGRIVLTNGSHRAYALRASGVTHAPCVIHNMRKQDELELVATDDVLAQLNDIVTASRPAMLKDYFDDELTIRFGVKRKQRQIKISYQIEVMDVPVAD